MSQLTKRALGNALKKLLSQSTLDKITVKEIVEECGVIRQTFYYHFQDIYELLEWTFLEEARMTLENKKTSQTWQEGYLQSLQYVVNNRTLIYNTYRSLGRDHLERYLYQLTEDLLTGVFRENEEMKQVSEEDFQFIVRFYKYAFVGLTLEWIGTGMKETPEEIVTKLNQLIEGDFKRALERFAK